MQREWLAAEHYRLHMMERWPEGSVKDAGLAAARSALENLTRTVPQASSYLCPVCAGRRHSISEVPRAPREREHSTTLAERSAQTRLPAIRTA
jgi:hypothetical protein